MKVMLDVRNFEKTLTNVVDYSFGFIDGVNKGKKKMLENLAEGIVEYLGNYIDAIARSDSQALHHVYEWYELGTKNGRLYNLNYTISNLGLSINSTFRQSTSISEKSTEPFYNKAYIMENGIPVTISPKRKALVFEEGGKTIFSSRPITINNPGGQQVEGSYQKTFDSFFKNYFTQAFLKSSGLYDYISNPKVYKKNIALGSKAGKNAGVKVGYTWIINAKLGEIDG